MPYAPQGAGGGGGSNAGNCKVSVLQYTGNYSGESVSHEITGVGFQPDFVMIFHGEELTPYGGPLVFWTSGETYGDGFTLNDVANADGYLYTAVCFKFT